MKADYTQIHPAGQQPQAVHPAGSRAKVLLSSVFGPYAQDDEYGSRTLNPMELYHNQVTRTQGLSHPGPVRRGDPQQPLRRGGHQLHRYEPT